MQGIESAHKSSRARIFFILPGSWKFALERSQKALHFVQRGRILLRCGSALALSLPSLGVSSLDLGRLFTQAALFSFGSKTAAAAERFRGPRQHQGLLQRRIDVAKLSVQVGAQAIHHCDDRKRDARCDQTVFNRRCP